MSETNPQKVIAAFRLGFLTGFFLDERHERGGVKHGNLWSIGRELLDATLATLGNEVDPDSQRRNGVGGLRQSTLLWKKSNDGPYRNVPVFFGILDSSQRLLRSTMLAMR